MAARRTDVGFDHGNDKRQLYCGSQQYFRLYLDLLADRRDGNSPPDNTHDYPKRTYRTLPWRQRDAHKQQRNGQYLEHRCYNAIHHSEHSGQLLGAMV